MTMQGAFGDEGVFTVTSLDALATLRSARPGLNELLAVAEPDRTTYVVISWEFGGHVCPESQLVPVKSPQSLSDGETDSIGCW